MNRLKYAARNTSATFITYILQALLAFGTRTAFILILGREVLGLDNLLLSIVAFIGFAELGINTAVAYSMYKPIADNDTAKIASLNTLLRRINYTLAGVILLIGVCITPILPLVTGNTAIKGINIYFAYAIFLLSSVVAYFSADKRLLLTAHQRGYILNFVNIVRLVFVATLQIIVLFVLQNYYLFLAVALVGVCIDNIVVFFAVRRMYPYIRGKSGKLDAATKAHIVKYVSAFSAFKISSSIWLALASVLLAIYFDLAVVGTYANYLLITSTITALVSSVVASLGATIGNAVATQSPKQNYSTFRTLNLCYWLVNGWCTICLLCLLQPFIRIWGGEGYLFSTPVMIAIVAQFFLNGVGRILFSYQYATGLAHKGWWRAFIEPVINVAAAVLLIQLWGLLGLFVAMALIMLQIGFWIVPYFVYKHYFQTGVWNFFYRVFCYTAVTVAIGAAAFFVCNLLPQGFWFVCLRGLVCTAFVIVGYAACYSWTRDFRTVYRVLGKGHKPQSQEPPPPQPHKAQLPTQE